MGEQEESLIACVSDAQMHLSVHKETNIHGNRFSIDDTKQDKSTKNIRDALDNDNLNNCDNEKIDKLYCEAERRGSPLLWDMHHFCDFKLDHRQGICCDSAIVWNVRDIDQQTRREVSIKTCHQHRCCCLFDICTL